MTRRAANVLLLQALFGCAPIIGSDGLEYTREDGDEAPAAPVARGECTGSKGPPSVEVDGKFCMDATEVTYAQYLEFIEAAPGLSQVPECDWNVDEAGAANFLPAEDWPPGEPLLQRPVTFVDWCDARAYCEWAGKRLCGAVGGGPLEYHSQHRSEMYYACSRDGEREYVHGNTFNPGACATSDRSWPVPVATFPGCEGGFEGIFDLGGNVAEWYESCEEEGNGFCRLGGGNAVSLEEHPYSFWSCSADMGGHPMGFNSGVGIRCCSEAL